MGIKLRISPVWLTVALIAPLCFFAGQLAVAAGPGSGTLIDKDVEACVHKIIGKRFYNRIGASDAQREKLDTLWQATSDGTRPMREELRAGMLDLSALYASDTATDEQIVSKAHELRALHEKITDQRLDSMLKARKVLTPEQRNQIDERIKDVITGGGAGGRLRQVSSVLDVS